jgi:hypothetical protein
VRQPEPITLPVLMSAPIAVDATAGLPSLPFTSSISNPWLVAVAVGMWSKARISRLPSWLGKRASLVLRSVGLLNRSGRPLSQGLSPADGPVNSLASYRLLSGCNHPSTAPLGRTQ